MKPKLKYSLIITIVAILLILNVQPVIIFWERASFSKYSFMPAFIMACIVTIGIFACVLRHKGNFLMFGGSRSVFRDDKDYTFTDEYDRRFRWMLLVYFAAVPFYIPLIFFTKSDVDLLWMLPVIFVPQAVFIAHGIYETLQDVEEEKRRQEQFEKERAEQEKREELGRWK